MAEQKLNEEKLDDIIKKVTVIHTVLIGNGIPGLVQKHEDLEKKVNKNHDTLRRIVYSCAGAMVVITMILNINQIIGLFK